MSTRNTIGKPLVVTLTALTLVVAVALTVQPRTTQAADKIEGIQSLRDTSDAFVAIAEDASQAVVFLDVESRVEPASFQGQLPDFFNRFFGPNFRGHAQPQQPQPPQFRRGQGSGFLISEDGYILTNNHVVEGAQRISVTMNDGREFTGEVVGTDPPSDLAVVKIDGDDLPYLALGDSDELRVGEWVIAIGNPFGLSHSVTAGIVSAKGRNAVGITDFADFIQTDAAINPGNSGGPLLNLDGDVVGVNTAIMSRSGGSMGVGFAIPITMASLIKDQLIDGGAVERGFLGVMIQDVTPEIADYFDVDENQGALIAEVNDDSPADKAGLERDDIVLKYDGKSVKNSAALRNLVALTRPGSSSRLTVLRDGDAKRITVDIGAREQDSMHAAAPAEAQQRLGIHLQNLTDELAQRFGYEDASGVLISEVEPGSSAARAGLRPGMLVLAANRMDVHNTKDFREALDKTRDDVVLLRVADERGSRYVTLRLN